MLQNLKVLLGIKDNDLDEKLSWILDSVRARLKLRLGGTEPPASMDHIITEVAAVRFNRIGSEGMSSHQVEGESIQYSTDDFAPFEPEIEAFLEAERRAGRGRLRFL